MGSVGILAAKLLIGLLGISKAVGAFLLGRKNRMIGRLQVNKEALEARVANAQAAKKARLAQRTADAGGVPDDGPDRFRRD